MDDLSSTAVFRCPGCGAVLPDSAFNSPSPVPCESCGTRSQVRIFPALVNGTARVEFGDSLQTDAESGCFYHPEKRAITVCESCGRFLCSLCEISLSGRKLCPNCLEAGKDSERITELITCRTLYDSLALRLALWPLLMVFATIITAPMAIYVSLRYWKAPTSILGRTKIRFILALVIALVELGGWTAFLYRPIINLVHRL